MTLLKFLLLCCIGTAIGRFLGDIPSIVRKYKSNKNREGQYINSELAKYYFITYKEASPAILNILESLTNLERDMKELKITVRRERVDALIRDVRNWRPDEESISTFTLEESK